MSDDEKTSYKVTTLKGSENYAEWELSISSTLIAKDFLDYTTVSVAPSDNKTKRNYQKAFALIIQSLSPVIQASLSHSARNFLTPNVQLLWEELRTQYSASTGARKAALLQEMWTTPIQESEDPMPRLASIRSAHAQINASSGLVSSDNSSTLSDEMLAFAMTMALPASYSTLQQTLWLRAPLTSAEVQNAVQAEFSRRKLHNPAALVARTSGNKPFTKKPNDNTKYCNYHKKNGHTTDECFTLKQIRQR